MALLIAIITAIEPLLDGLLAAGLHQLLADAPLLPAFLSAVGTANQTVLQDATPLPQALQNALNAEIPK